MADPGRRRLGDILVARGTLSEDELAMVLAEQQRTGQLLGELVVALGLATSSAVAAALADKHGWSNAGDVTGSDGAPDATAAPEPPSARPRAPEFADTEASNPPVDLPGVPQSARPGDLQTRDAEPAEARAREAEQAAEIERLGRALADQAAAAERSSAELEAAHTRLAGAETELAAAQEALEARTIELETLRDQLRHQQSHHEAAGQFDADRHLLFLPTAGGYRLVERSGPAPKPGSRVDVGGGLGGRSGYLVLKTIRAPLPGTRLLCAYLQPL